MRKYHEGKIPYSLIKLNNIKLFYDLKFVTCEIKTEFLIEIFAKISA